MLTVVAVGLSLTTRSGTDRFRTEYAAVSVVSPCTKMSWAAAPPSDQPSNSNGTTQTFWSVALTLIRSPVMIVRVNGVVPTPRASIDSPGGVELIVTVDTFG